MNRRLRGFTLVELLAYLAIFTVMTGTIVGAELSARRLNRAEAATLEAIYEIDRLFAAIAEECDKATSVRLDAPGKAAFAGGSTFAARDGHVERDAFWLTSHVKELSFTQPDAASHPRLLHVRVKILRTWGPKDSFERTYERTFRMRNLAPAEANRGNF